MIRLMIAALPGGVTAFEEHNETEAVDWIHSCMKSSSICSRSSSFSYSLSDSRSGDFLPEPKATAVPYP